ncbi:hypothetical protein RRG08_046628 [Elysia crispata]|uniref:Uncharacterized protein n=1 Tax=Elysia crispata TaxID=231223 RepID=A0AAE1E240_9GAST|nr:hypothetical protein RRG08_046628 [Elysia crispata]
MLDLQDEVSAMKEEDLLTAIKRKNRVTKTALGDTSEAMSHPPTKAKAPGDTRQKLLGIWWTQPWPDEC